MLAYLRMIYMKLVSNFPQIAAHAFPRLSPFTFLGLNAADGSLRSVQTVVTIPSHLAVALGRFQPRSGFWRGCRAVERSYAATTACAGRRLAGQLDGRGNGGRLGMRRCGAGSDALFRLTRKEEVVGVRPPKG